MGMVDWRRVMAILCIVSLHLLLFKSGFKTAPPAAPELVRYMTIWNPPRLAPQRAPTLALPSLARASSVRPMAVRQISPKPVFAVAVGKLVDKPLTLPMQAMDIDPKPGLDTPSAARAAPLNIENMLAAVRVNEKSRVPTAVELVREKKPLPLTLEEKVAEAARRAERRDCRNESSQPFSGLLALVPIVHSALTGTGCKW
jgi:hypothetical protein